MEPLAVHHVTINVDDVAKGTAFYTDVLGGTLRGDRPDMRIDGAWIDLGVSQVHLVELEVPPPMGQHFAIQVADIEEAVSELRAQGITVSDPNVVGTGRQSFLEDPFGNAIEIHQVGIAGA
jgi:glyoxylase I family protein